MYHSIVIVYFPLYFFIDGVVFIVNLNFLAFSFNNLVYLVSSIIPFGQ